MRYLLLLLLLSLPAAAQDSPGTVRRKSEAQALTRAAPTASCLATSSPEGMDLRGVRGFRVFVSAESGQTLSGAGNLRAWVYEFSTGLWARNPSLDLAVSASSVRTSAFPDQEVVSRTGCVLYAADGVTVSGGTTVTVTIVGYTGGV